MAELPILPGLMNEGAAQGVGVILEQLTEDQIGALVAEATRAKDAGELADYLPADEEPDPEDPNEAAEGEEEAPADPEAPTPTNPENAAPEGDPAAPAAGLGDADSYAKLAADAAAEIAEMVARANELLEGAEEHKKAGLDPSGVEDAIATLTEAQDEADEAKQEADDAASGDEPDHGAAASAAHKAAAARDKARAAIAAAEQALTEAADAADDPEIAAMRAWADATLQKKL